MKPCRKLQFKQLFKKPLPLYVFSLQFTKMRVFKERSELFLAFCGDPF
jgi:hypothetical protein